MPYLTINIAEAGTPVISRHCGTEFDYKKCRVRNEKGKADGIYQ